MLQAKSVAAHGRGHVPARKLSLTASTQRLHIAKDHHVKRLSTSEGRSGTTNTDAVVTSQPAKAGNDNVAPSLDNGSSANASSDVRPTTETLHNSSGLPTNDINRTVAGSKNPGNDAVRTWLNQPVPLPAGYTTSRRELLKLGSLGGAAACFYVAFSRSKAMSFASPQALLNAVMPPQAPPAADTGSDRVAAFKRYIADLERRGGGREVPDFPSGADWLNTAPLSMARATSGPLTGPAPRGSLTGRIVLLDFWTYCCINCIHVLPDLAQLESQFAGAPVAVVGVHSAKFDNEKDSSAIRDAVLRYDISHPVVNDRSMALWGGLGVSSWPTLAVVSPRGRLIAMLSGEGHRQDLEDLITAALQYYGEAGQLDGSIVLPLDLERTKQSSAPSPLRYPGKLAVDSSGTGRLFIADSNNHRILVTDLGGKCLEQIGGNGPALQDGSFEGAAFNRPQGLVYSPRRNMLYVADTENHAVRCCDLTARTVLTLAGNGSKGRDYRGGRAGTAQSLNSPWDVELNENEDTLYIALAGQHQLWKLQLDTEPVAALFSGTGAERCQNGPTALTTSWAQPSGLTRARDESGLMYVADSESSSVRVVDLGTGGSSLKAGGDPLFSDNLFRFGDTDGFGSEVLLQHPLAVTSSADGTTVYIADSYNHRIKALNPATNEVTTLAGSGTPGFKDGIGTATAFSEPAGLALGPGGQLFIADTNNNAIRVLDPATRRVTTLTLSGVPDPRVDPLAAIAANGAAPAALPVGYQLVRSQLPLLLAGLEPGTVRVNIALPAGYHLTAGAGSSYFTQVLAAPGMVSTDVTAVSVRPASGSLPDTAEPSVQLEVSPTATGAAGGGRLLLRLLARVYYCRQNDVCLYEQVAFEVPIELPGRGDAVAASGWGQRVVSLRYAVVPAAQPGFALI